MGNVFYPFYFNVLIYLYSNYKSTPPEVFLGKSVLKICSKFTGEHPYQSVISIKLLYNFIEIALWEHLFLRTPLDDFLQFLNFYFCFYKFVTKSSIKFQNANLRLCLFSGTLSVTNHRRFCSWVSPMVFIW